MGGTSSRYCLSNHSSPLKVSCVAYHYTKACHVILSNYMENVMPRKKKLYSAKASPSPLVLSYRGSFCSIGLWNKVVNALTNWGQCPKKWERGTSPKWRVKKKGLFVHTAVERGQWAIKGSWVAHPRSLLLWLSLALHLCLSPLSSPSLSAALRALS